MQYNYEKNNIWYPLFHTFVECFVHGFYGQYKTNEFCYR